MIYDWTDYIYQIDDSNIDCGRIIVTTCDPYIHEYRDPCQIVETCLNNLGWPDIDRCDMVTDIPGALPGAFLRIDNTGNCVEWIDPAIVIDSFNTDEMVSVDGTDPAGYLETKLISSDGSITISKLAGTLDLITNGVHNFLDLNDTPSSYVGHDGDMLKVNGNSVVFVPDDRSQRCVRYLEDNQSWIGTANNIERWPLNSSYAEGNPAMPGQTNYPLGTFYRTEIQKTGMYNVWFNGGLRFNNGVAAIKISVMTSEGGDKAIILSSKNGVLGASPMPIVDEDRGMEEKWMSFSEKGLFKLNAGTRILFLVRVDSQAGNNIAPIVEVEGRTLYTGDLSGVGGEIRAHKYCGTQFGVSWYSEITHNAV